MTAVVVGLLVLAAAAAAGVPIIRWWSERRLTARELPPLVIPFREARAGSAEPVPMLAPRPAPRATQAVGVETVARPDHGIRAPELAPSEVQDRKPVPNETIRFRRPTEEPVQLLPGRLEVLAGDSGHREIRFIRIPGEPMQLILGRESGPSAQYVALRSGTVSRRHARFAFEAGRWSVSNLSKTNPVVVNDEELGHAEGERPLEDGDRIELGEVIFRFHAR
jgi:hypothetical protein